MLALVWLGTETWIRGWPEEREEMIPFYLRRDEDVSGTSGTGVVAEGVRFQNGWVALNWLTEYRSIAFYESVEDLEAIHGHGGRTKIVWLQEVK